MTPAGRRRHGAARLPGAARLHGAGRLPGVDLARGLAVLGMLAAHLYALPALRWGQPATWSGVADGRSSILFATLAGASIALVTGGPRPLAGPGRAAARYRLTARAAILFLAGVLLIALDVPIAVILPTYAVLFLLALPLLGLRARTLWILAGALAVTMPWVQPLLDALPLWRTRLGGELAVSIGWHYPFPVWSAFLVAGMAAGRSDLRRTRTPLILLVAGAVAAVGGYALDADFRARSGVASGPGSDHIAAVWTAAPHSSGILEVVASGGFALAVLGACVLVCRTPLTWLALPLRAVGSMPLTAYAAQVVAWAIAARILTSDVRDIALFRALEPFWAFAAFTILGCTTWALLLGRGPLERLTALAAEAVTARCGRRASR